MLITRSKRLYEWWKEADGLQAKAADHITSAILDTTLEIVGDPDFYRAFIWAARVYDAGADLSEAVTFIDWPRLGQTAEEALGKVIVRQAVAMFSDSEDRAVGLVDHVGRARREGLRGMSQGMVDNYATRFTQMFMRSSQEGAESVMRASMERGRRPEETVAIVQRVFGLDHRRATGAERFFNTLTGSKNKKLSRLTEHTNRAKIARADTYGRTEAATIHNLGDRFWYQGLFPDSELVWVTAADERTCSVCAPMDGDMVPVEALFETKSGEVLVPPVHPNCRCKLVPEEALESFGVATTRTRLRRAA